MMLLIGAQINQFKNILSVFKSANQAIVIERWKINECINNFYARYTRSTSSVTRPMVSQIPDQHRIQHSSAENGKFRWKRADSTTLLKKNPRSAENCDPYGSTSSSVSLYLSVSLSLCFSLSVCLFVGLSLIFLYLFGYIANSESFWWWLKSRMWDGCDIEHL